MKKIILFTLSILFFTAVAVAQIVNLNFEKKQAYLSDNQINSSSLLADSITQSVWDNNTWKDDLRVYLSYDANNRVKQEITRTLSDGELSGRKTYQYDAQNRLISVENEEYHQGSWVPHDKTVYQFNSNGHRTSGIKYLHYGMQGYLMHEGDSFSYVYQGGNIVSYIVYQIANGVARPFQQLLWSSLNAQNQPTQLEVRTYNSGIYDPYLKLDQITWRLGYDPIDFMFSSYFGYQWNAQAQTWTPQVYDTTLVLNGRRLVNYLYSWNGSAIGQQSMRQYSYDAFGHQWKEEHFQWINNQWGQVYAELDSNVYGSQDEIRVNILGFRQRPTDPWNFVRKLVYHYQGTSSVKEQEAKLTSTIFPNPGNGKFQILNACNEPYHVAVYDMSGKLLLDVDQPYQIEVPKSGSYLILIFYTDRVERHMFISVNH